MNPLPSIRQTYSSVSHEEKQRILSSSHTTIEPSNSAAMAVRGRPNPGRNERFNRSYGSQERQMYNFRQDRRRQGTVAGRGRPICSHYGEMGHWVQTCYELNGYPVGHQKTKFQPGSRGFHNRARPAVHNVAESPWARPATNNVAESSSRVDGNQFIGISETQLKQLLSLVSKKDDSTSQVNTVNKSGLSKITSRNWIIDSGATDHISS